MTNLLGRLVGITDQEIELMKEKVRRFWRIAIQNLGACFQ